MEIRSYKMDFPDGSYYEGTVLRGKFEGYGSMVFAKVNILPRICIYMLF